MLDLPSALLGAPLQQQEEEEGPLRKSSHFPHVATSQGTEPGQGGLRSAFSLAGEWRGKMEEGKAYSPDGELSGAQGAGHPSTECVLL